MHLIPSRKWTQSGIAAHPPRVLQLALQFGQFFSFCGLVLPKDMIEKRRSGFVGDGEEVDQSFFVAHFCFGKDGDREYLDFYMCSQRTGDLHRRMYEDGEHQYLPVHVPGP